MRSPPPASTMALLRQQERLESTAMWGYHMQNVLRLRYFLYKNPVISLQQTLEIGCFFLNAHFRFRKRI